MKQQDRQRDSQGSEQGVAHVFQYQVGAAGALEGFFWGGGGGRWRLQFELRASGSQSRGSTA
jgi:hypothetical protein